MRDTYSPNELVRYPVRVQLEELGEGLQGDYNPDDPNDVELIRFYIDQWNPSAWQLFDKCWEAIDDASYCTQLPVSLTAEQRQQAMKHIMDCVWGNVVEGKSIKRICEMLSWMDEDTIKDERLVKTREEAMQDTADYVQNIVLNDQEITCPSCGNDTVEETDGMFAEKQFIYRYLKCTECGQEFHLTYSLCDAWVRSDVRKI